MAGLIVAGYDAVHKQGQVFKLSLKDIKILLFSLLLKTVDMLLFLEGVVRAHWRHVRAPAHDHWRLWVILPLWNDGPHLQGEHEQHQHY